MVEQSSISFWRSGVKGEVKLGQARGRAVENRSFSGVDFAGSRAQSGERDCASGVHRGIVFFGRQRRRRRPLSPAPHRRSVGTIVRRRSLAATAAGRRRLHHSGELLSVSTFDHSITLRSLPATTYVPLCSWALVLWAQTCELNSLDSMIHHPPCYELATRVVAVRFWGFEFKITEEQISDYFVWMVKFPI